VHRKKLKILKIKEKNLNLNKKEIQDGQHRIDAESGRIFPGRSFKIGKKIQETRSGEKLQVIVKQLLTLI
jgi:hypothetical protein